jgi:hypothetical protein
MNTPDGNYCHSKKNNVKIYTYITCTNIQCHSIPSSEKSTPVNKANSRTSSPERAKHSSTGYRHMLKKNTPHQALKGRNTLTQGEALCFNKGEATCSNKGESQCPNKGEATCSNKGESLHSLPEKNQPQNHAHKPTLKH